VRTTEDEAFTNPMNQQVFEQALGIELYVQPVKIEFVDFDLIVPNSGFGPGKFMDNTTITPETNRVLMTGSGANFSILSGAPKAVTKAAVASGTATLTFGAIHGITVGSTIIVQGLPAPFAGLNATVVVTAVTTSSPFTLSYATTAATAAEATVTGGTAMPTTANALKLDGTDPPFRLQGLNNCSEQQGGNQESTVTYDSSNRGFAQGLTVSKSVTWSVGGMVNYRSPAYWLIYFHCLSIADQHPFMLKYLRIDKNGIAKYGYGSIPEWNEPAEAATLVKINNNLVGYGPMAVDKPY
jgi:hypothetical protein